MKKNIFLLALLLVIGEFCAQNTNKNIGINTTNPQATLDIVAKSDGSTSPEGILIPRLTNAQILAMPITNAQKGLLVYNTDKDCIQSFTNNIWDCLQSVTQNKYLVAEYTGSTGVWMQNVSASGNTVSYKLTNHSTATFTALNFQSALQLSGASGGLSYTPAADYSNVSIGAGQSIIVTYNISGIPQSFGTLTAKFSTLGGIVMALGTINIQEQSQVKALSLTFSGNYVSNKNLTGTKVTLKVHNYSVVPVVNTDLSNSVSLGGIQGLSIAPGQNTSVNIPVGGEVDLDYNITGAAIDQGNLLAYFNSNATVSGSVNATQIIPLFSNATVSNMQILGDYVFGQNMDANNKVQVTLTNNNAFNLVKLNLKDALSLSGNYQNLIVIANQNTDVSIPANGTLVVSYSLQNMPAQGGVMTATWQKNPFGTVTANKNVAAFSVSPNAFNFPVGGGSGTITINSDQPWQAEAPSWITLNATTGGSGITTLSFTTTSHTTAADQIGIIRIFRSDNNAVKVYVNQPPTDDFTINLPIYNNPDNSPWNNVDKFSINGTPKTFTTPYGGTWSVYSKPDWVESATISGNTLTITPKVRTTAGLQNVGNIVFQYGGGYLKSYTIIQKQKAEKCPQLAPFLANKGYQIHPNASSITPRPLTLYEERPGVNNFTDVGIVTYAENWSEGVYSEISYSTNSSKLFIGPSDRDYPNGYRAGGGYSNGTYYYAQYWYAYKNPNNSNKISGLTWGIIWPLPQLAGSKDLEKATIVYCFDGLDENTPQ